MLQLQSLRTNLRKNGQHIIDYLEENFIKRVAGKAKRIKEPGICLFCNMSTNISREHVLPRWAFEKKTESFFTTTINGLKHTYNRTTIPACLTCNTAILNTLEKRINDLFSTHTLPDTYFTNEELEDIVRWLEVIEYKLQVFSVTTKFLAPQNAAYISFLADYPLSVLDPNIDYSPAKALSGLRQALKRITVKSKHKHLNSLVIFKTSNPEMSFFHKNNDYIFLELPQKQIALFYFFKKIFSDVIQARDEAMDIIQKHY